MIITRAPGLGIRREHLLGVPLERAGHGRKAAIRLTGGGREAEDRMEVLRSLTAGDERGCSASWGATKRCFSSKAAIPCHLLTPPLVGARLPLRIEPILAKRRASAIRPDAGDETSCDGRVPISAGGRNPELCGNPVAIDNGLPHLNLHWALIGRLLLQVLRQSLSSGRRVRSSRSPR